jgi:predicted phage tail protein
MIPIGPGGPEKFGFYISDFGNISKEPYTRESLPDITVGSAISFPIKTAAAIGIARQGWNMARSVGMFSSLSEGSLMPFNDDILRARYRSRTVNGLAKRVLDIVNPWGNHPVASEQGYAKFLEKSSFGFMDNRMLGLDNLTTRLKDAGVEIADEKEFLKSLHKNIYKTPMSEAAFNTGKYKEVHERLSKKRTVTMWDILTGGKKVPGISTEDTLKDRYKKIFLDKDVGLFADSTKEGKVFRVFGKGTSRSKARLFAHTSEAVHATIREKSSIGSLAKQHLTPALGKNIADTTNIWAANVASTAARYRAARLAVGGIMAVSLAAEAFKGVVKLGGEVTNRVATTMRGIHQVDFGGNHVMNDKMATERQRALSEIQNAQMNARYLLGSEASLYH